MCAIITMSKKERTPNGARSYLYKGAGGMAQHKASNPFYHTKAWKRARAEALRRDRGMCSDCMDRIRAGYGIKPRRAVVVHHIQPIEERPDLALTLSNLRSLCEICHNRAHPEKGRRQEARLPVKMRVIKI